MPSEKTMGKHKYWTPDEDAFLIEFYPTHGAKETLAELTKRFGERHTLQSLHDRCHRYLHLKVTSEQWRRACLNNGNRQNMPIGTITKRGRGENWIKVADGTDGWMPYKEYLMGKQSGNMIVHLNMDKADDRKENLMVIDRRTSARMTGHDLWSTDTEISRTAVLCCQLENAVEDVKLCVTGEGR